MKTLIVIGLVLAAALIAVAPTASAGPVPEPECVQVYPWSEVCKGNVGPVVCWYVEGTPEEVCQPLR